MAFRQQPQWNATRRGKGKWPMCVNVRLCKCTPVYLYIFFHDSAMFSATFCAGHTNPGLFFGRFLPSSSFPLSASRFPCAIKKSARRASVQSQPAAWLPIRISMGKPADKHIDLWTTCRRCWCCCRLYIPIRFTPYRQPSQPPCNSLYKQPRQYIVFLRPYVPIPTWLVHLPVWVRCCVRQFGFAWRFRLDPFSRAVFRDHREDSKEYGIKG